MTKVGKLIEMLREMPPEHEVWLEGCDCWNLATRPIIEGGTVLIGADIGNKKEEQDGQNS